MAAPTAYCFFRWTIYRKDIPALIDARPDRPHFFIWARPTSSAHLRQAHRGAPADPSPSSLVPCAGYGRRSGLAGWRVVRRLRAVDHCRIRKWLPASRLQGSAFQHERSPRFPADQRPARSCPAVRAGSGPTSAAALAGQRRAPLGGPQRHLRDVAGGGAGLSAGLVVQQTADHDPRRRYPPAKRGPGRPGLAGRPPDRRGRGGNPIWRGRRPHPPGSDPGGRAARALPRLEPAPNAGQHQPATAPGTAGDPRPAADHGPRQHARPGRLRERHLLRPAPAGAAGVGEPAGADGLRRLRPRALDDHLRHDGRAPGRALAVDRRR